MTTINTINSDSTASAASGVGANFSRTGPNQAEGAGTFDMSFGDVLDMINPLQHIPVVSSIYRAATGETINPVSRVAGDTLYSGIMGLASAGVSALGALGDEIYAANNDGQTLSGTVVASLFGSDEAPASQDTQWADNAAPAAATPQTTQTQNFTQLASLQTPAKQSPILQMPDFPAATAQAAATNIPAPTAAATATTSDTQTAAATPAAATGFAGKAFPLDRSKPAYGGVMDTAMLQSAQQNQTLAMAMAGQSGILQAQRQLRSNRFATALPVAPATPPVAAQVSTPATTAASAPDADAPPTPQTQAAMQSLIQELQAMKSTNQYRNAAQNLPLPGVTMNSAY